VAIRGHPGTGGGRYQYGWAAPDGGGGGTMMVVFFAGGGGLLLLNDTHPVSANGISTVAEVRYIMAVLRAVGKSGSATVANVGFVMSNHP
jgi:hypothetical protein